MKKRAKSLALSRQGSGSAVVLLWRSRGNRVAEIVTEMQRITSSRQPEKRDGQSDRRGIDPCPAPVPLDRMGERATGRQCLEKPRNRLSSGLAPALSGRLSAALPVAAPIRLNFHRRKLLESLSIPPASPSLLPAPARLSRNAFVHAGKRNSLLGERARDVFHSTGRVRDPRPLVSTCCHHTVHAWTWAFSLMMMMTRQLNDDLQIAYSHHPRKIPPPYFSLALGKNGREDVSMEHVSFSA